MLAGKIIDLVCRSPATHRAGGLSYGILQGDDGAEIYFSQTLVEGLHGFDDLRRGQRLEYTLDDPFLRAASVRSVAAGPARPMLAPRFQALKQPAAFDPNVGRSAASLGAPIVSTTGD